MSDPRKGGRSAVRRFALPLALLVFGLPAGLLVVMAVGKPPPDKDPFIPVDALAAGRERTAQPRWEPVSTITGTGSTDASFRIAAGASQWKASMACDGGRMHVTDAAAADSGEMLADTACPHSGVETRTDTGPHRLHVSATGSWRIVVEQQVSTALMRAPLPGMTPATRIAHGEMRTIQRRTEGSVDLYRLPSGRLALRFENFYTTGSPGLEVWLSQAANPRSTLAARDASHVNAGQLRSTLGTYNQLLPREATVDEIRSIVIWCPTVTIAFGAANLRPA
ncbi:MAG: DM13 domain-containing protein [Solirubrobacteraceae bacterium]|nr:DM13 domain-containing protein [Solirubrobacteraceae bacterium]